MTHTHEAMTAAAERAAQSCDNLAQTLRCIEHEHSCDGEHDAAAVFANRALARESDAAALLAIGPELARLTAENERLREALDPDALDEIARDIDAGIALSLRAAAAAQRAAIAKTTGDAK